MAATTTSFGNQVAGRGRRSTIREGAAEGPIRKKNAQEEKELLGDVEGKSPFRCSYGPRFHGAQEERKEEGGYGAAAHRHRSKDEAGGCRSCITQIKEKERFEIKKKEDEKYFAGKDDMPFDMLIKYLMAKPTKENTKEKMLSGCEVFFPDTLFFEKDVPAFRTKTDNDGCLAKWNDNDENKPMPHAGDLIQKLHKTIIERKKNTGFHWLQLGKMARQEKNRQKAAQE